MYLFLKMGRADRNPWLAKMPIMYTFREI